MSNTRVRVADHSEIIDFSKNKTAWRELLVGTGKGHKHGVSDMVRNLRPYQGFFVSCPDDRRFSHVYKVASDAGMTVTIRRGTHEGMNGCWILRTE